MSADAVAVAVAIRASWSKETSADPSRWSRSRPAIGQCDVSSFVAWEHLGGDLVLAEVLVDGERREHHYWNRIGGRDIDLTAEQFEGHEEVVELSALGHDDVERRTGEMRPELAARISLLRERVALHLAVDEPPRSTVP